MAESKFVSSEIVVVQLKLNAKKQKHDLNQRKRSWMSGKQANDRKFNPKLEEYEHEDLDKKLQKLYPKARTKDGFFYNFVENITNKKSYDRSSISWYMVTCDIFIKSSQIALDRLRLETFIKS